MGIMSELDIELKNSSKDLQSYVDHLHNQLAVLSQKIKLYKNNESPDVEQIEIIAKIRVILISQYKIEECKLNDLIGEKFRKHGSTINNLGLHKFVFRDITRQDYDKRVKALSREEKIHEYYREKDRKS